MSHLTRQKANADESTKAQQLLLALSDRRWHPTQELVHRVGHTFAGAKFRLVRTGYVVEKCHHEQGKRQWQYRLADGPRGRTPPQRPPQRSKERRPRTAGYGLKTA